MISCNKAVEQEMNLQSSQTSSNILDHILTPGSDQGSSSDQGPRSAASSSSFQEAFPSSGMNGESDLNVIEDNTTPSLDAQSQPQVNSDQPQLTLEDPSALGKPIEKFMEVVNMWILSINFKSIDGDMLNHILHHFYTVYTWTGFEVSMSEAMLQVRQVLAKYIKNNTSERHDIIAGKSFRKANEVIFSKLQEHTLHDYQTIVGDAFDFESIVKIYSSDAFNLTEPMSLARKVRERQEYHCCQADYFNISLCGSRYCDNISDVNILTCAQVLFDLTIYLTSKISTQPTRWTVAAFVVNSDEDGELFVTCNPHVLNSFAGEFKMYSKPDCYLCPVYSFIMMRTLLDRESELLFQKPLEEIQKGATSWYSGEQFSRYNLNKLMQEIAVFSNLSSSCSRPKIKNTVSKFGTGIFDLALECAMIKVEEVTPGMERLRTAALVKLSQEAGPSRFRDMYTNDGKLRNSQDLLAIAKQGEANCKTDSSVSKPPMATNRPAGRYVRSDNTAQQQYPQPNLIFTSQQRFNVIEARPNQFFMPQPSPQMERFCVPSQNVHHYAQPQQYQPQTPLVMPMHQPHNFQRQQLPANKVSVPGNPHFAAGNVPFNPYDNTRRFTPQIAGAAFNHIETNGAGSPYSQAPHMKQVATPIPTASASNYNNQQLSSPMQPVLRTDQGAGQALVNFNAPQQFPVGASTTFVPNGANVNNGGEANYNGMNNSNAGEVSYNMNHGNGEVNYNGINNSNAGEIHYNNGCKRQKLGNTVDNTTVSPQFESPALGAYNSTSCMDLLTNQQPQQQSPYNNFPTNQSTENTNQSIAVGHHQASPQCNAPLPLPSISHLSPFQNNPI